MKRPFYLILFSLIILTILYHFIFPSLLPEYNNIDKDFNAGNTWEKYSAVAAIKKPAAIENDTLPTSSIYIFSGLKIYLTQRRPRSNEYGCFAGIKILRDTNVIYSKIFENIEALGGYAGLFVPKKQPLKNYFLINKHGSYNGVQLIIDTSGTVKEMPGGDFFITNDMKYMFVLQDIDGTLPFRVIDLSTMKLVFHSHTDEYGMHSKYIDYYNADFFKKHEEIYVSLIGDKETKLYKYDFEKQELNGNIQPNITSLAYIDFYKLYENVQNCDCDNNVF